MSVLRERPRFVAALCVALVVLLGLAMLAGGALAGDDNCATAADSGMHTPTLR